MCWQAWPGGTAWITGASLLDRQALMARITGRGAQVPATPATMQAGSGTKGRGAFFDRWVAALPAPWQQAESIRLLLLAIPPVDSVVLDRQASGALVRSLLADPAYHLK
jgi:hypothetical protein